VPSVTESGRQGRSAREAEKDPRTHVMKGSGEGGVRDVQLCC
jgi:hypothetical protein